MISNNFYIQLAAITLMACSGIKPVTERIQDNMSCQTVPTSIPPDWVFGNSQNIKDSYYGIGVSDGFDTTFNAMKRLSRANAEVELSSSIEVRITSRLNSDIREESKSTSNEYKRTVNQVIKSNTDMLLSDVELDGTWFNHETCQLWTRVRLTKESLQASQNQMKSMIQIKLEEAASNVASIKSTIENDPVVILRKSGLTTTSYMKALGLEINDKDLFSILDIYANYGNGITPNSASHVSGYGYSEPYLSFQTSMYQKAQYYPVAGVASIIQMLSAFNNDNENLLAVSLRYMIRTKEEEMPTKIMNRADHDRWYKSAKSILDKESDRLTQLHKKNISRLLDNYTSNLISKERYEKENEKLQNNISQDWRNHDKKYNEIHSPSNQINDMEKYTDHIYAIHFASCYGSPKNIKTLKENGYPMMKQTKKGFSALDVAISCNNNDNINFLNQ